jgi:hypothetical protein
MEQTRSGEREHEERMSEMKLASTLLLGCLLALTVSTSSAVIIEDFEDGDISDWTITSAGVYAAVTAAAAHDGSYGLEMEGGGTNEWMYRDDAAVQVEQGYVISYWTKTNDGSWSRNYCGFGSTAAGTYSASLGVNTATFIIHLVPGYSSYTTLADVPQAFAYNTWYRVEVHWDVGGLITAYLYDSDGTTLLNTVSVVDNTYTSGGIAARAFGGTEATVSDDPDLGSNTRSFGCFDTFDASTGPIAVEASSWSGVKALYR